MYWWIITSIDCWVLVSVGNLEYLHHQLLQKNWQFSNFGRDLHFYSTYDDRSWSYNEFRVTFGKNYSSSYCFDSLPSSSSCQHFYLLLHERFLDFSSFLWNSLWFDCWGSFYDSYGLMQQIFTWKKNVYKWCNFDGVWPWICCFWTILIQFSQSFECGSSKRVLSW